MSPSVYAKPVIPRIVVRPALITLALHGLLAFLLVANWEFGEREVIRVKPAPKVINARLVDASELRPTPVAAPPTAVSKPAPVPKPTPKPKPKPKPEPAPKPKATPEPKPKAQEKPRPKPEPERKVAPAPDPAISAAALRELMAAELAQSAAAEQQATAQQMTASLAALIQQTVQGYWSRPPSARNGMQALLQVQLIPTGEVVSVTVLESSGNAAFDRSAVNAVEKAGAFPELQQLPGGEFERNWRRFEFLFRPEDLRY